MNRNWDIKDLSVVRSPLLPLSFYYNILSTETNPENIVKLVLSNQYIKEAIYFANPTLANELEKYSQKSTKKKRNIVTALYKYLSRISTKSIPFGLFAGVQEASFVSEDSVFINTTEKEFQKHIRVDSMWLLGVISEIETQEHLWNFIHVKFSDLYLKEGDRVFFPYSSSYGQITNNNQEERKEFSIKNNELVNKVISETLEFIPLSLLVSNLKKSYKDIDEEQIKYYLKNLINNEILLTNLRPNLTSENNLLDLLIFFEKNNITHELNYKLLLNIKNKIIQYSKLKLGDLKGIELLENIQTEMQQLYESKDYLHIDLKILRERKIPIELKNNIENFLDILSLFLIENTSSNNIIPLKNALIEKYGYNTEINLIELLYSLEFTEYSTIGPVYNTDILKNNKIFNYMESLINNALFQGLEEIEINDEQINKLKKNYSIDNSKINESFDLLFSMVTDGDNTYFTINNTISDNAGQLIGRFFYLLENRYKEEADKINSFEKKVYGENYEITEVTCQSVNGRSSNICSTINLRDFELPIFSGISNKKTNIKISSIYCGINNLGELYLRNSDTNKFIIPKTTNMLHGINDFPEIYRFLLDIDMEGKIPFQTIFPILSNKFIFTPRIRYKNFILLKKHWRIDKYILNLEDQFNYEEWENSIIKWKTIYKVPNIVELKNADSTIFFNLDNPLHLKILKKEFSKYNKLLFTEIDFGIDTSCITKKLYKEELTLSIFNNKYLKKNTISSVNKTSHKRKIIPGDGWIYYKMYIKECYQDTLLIDVIFPAMKKLLEKDKISSYFYIRYKDSRPHIRLRIKVDPSNFTFLIMYMYDLTKKCLDSNLIDSLSIDTYYPEYSRYGGDSLEVIIHKTFFWDSQFSIKLLDINKQIGETTENIIMYSLKCLLRDMGLTKEKQINVIRKYLNSIGNIPKHHNSFVEIFDFESIPELQVISNYRASILKKYSTELEKTQLSEFEKDEIILSIIHMNINRLMIINRERENQIMFNLINFLSKN